MLPNGSIVQDALLGFGIAAALEPGALVVEMSSSDPSDTVGLAAGLAGGGVRVVDAPAPAVALADDRWAKALGPAADQSMAHQAWWDDQLGDQ